MKKWYITFLVLLFTLTPRLFAQNTGIINFLVEVDNGYFEIEINDTLLLKRYRDTLPAGNYTAKVWSPGYVTTPIDFTVIAGKTTQKHVKMARNNDFIRYEEEYAAYRMQFHKQLTVPLSVSLASALTSGVFMVRAYQTYQLLQDDIALYELSAVASEVSDIKQRINNNLEIYNRQRTAFYITGGLTLGFVGYTIWSYTNFKKNNVEPIFNKESPFKDKYSFQITPYGCGFTMHI